MISRNVDGLRMWLGVILYQFIEIKIKRADESCQPVGVEDVKMVVRIEEEGSCAGGG